MLPELSIMIRILGSTLAVKISVSSPYEGLIDKNIKPHKRNKYLFTYSSLMLFGDYFFAFSFSGLQNFLDDSLILV
jgi:hypothetical protein